MSQPSKPARAATPVLLSPTAKNLWRNGRLIRPQSNYGEWSAMISNERGVVFIDAFRLIADCYEKLGHETVQPLFCSAADNVHTGVAGAKLNAKCVADGLLAAAKRQRGDAFETLLHSIWHR